MIVGPMQIFSYIIGLIETTLSAVFWAEAFGFEPRAYSRGQLKKMSKEKLQTIYTDSFEIAVLREVGEKSVTAAEGRLAIEKCVTVFDRLSELEDGPHGNLFRRETRKQLRKDVRTAGRARNKT